MQSSVKGFAVGNVYASQNGIPNVNTQYKASILGPSKINMIVDNLLNDEENKYVIIRSMNDKDIFRLKMNQIDALHKNNMENRLQHIFNQPLPLPVEKQMLVKPTNMPVRLRINMVEPNKKSVKSSKRSPKKKSKKRKQTNSSVSNKKSSKTSSKKARKSSRKTTSRKNTALGKTIY